MRELFSGPGLLFAGILVLLHSVTRVHGQCERHLTTDGYVFRFGFQLYVQKWASAEEEENIYWYDDNDAFRIYQAGVTMNGNSRGYLYFRFNDYETGAISSRVWAYYQVNARVWYNVFVEKTLTHICITYRGHRRCQAKPNSKTSKEWRMKTPGVIGNGNGSNFEVKGYYQDPMTHYETHNISTFLGDDAIANMKAPPQYNTYDARYYLVGIVSTTAAYVHNVNPAYDYYVDTTEPHLGSYVKPRWGNYTRLRYECGYQVTGVMGFIEVKGRWEWPVMGDLHAVEDAHLVDHNVHRWPSLPGFQGNSSRDVSPWNDWGNGWYPQFGGSGFTNIDGKTAARRRGGFACDPFRTNNVGSYVAWKASTYVRRRHQTRFIRVWLGVDEGDQITSTTTMTCTTSTSSTTTTSTTTTITGRSTITRTTTTLTTMTSVTSSSSTSSTTASSSTFTTSTSTTSNTTTDTRTTSSSSTSTSTATSSTETTATTMTSTTTTSVTSTTTDTTSTTSTLTTTLTTSTVTTVTTTTTSTSTSTKTTSTTSTETTTLTTSTYTTTTITTSTSSTSTVTTTTTTVSTTTTMTITHTTSTITTTLTSTTTATTTTSRTSTDTTSTSTTTTLTSTKTTTTTSSETSTMTSTTTGSSTSTTTKTFTTSSTSTSSTTVTSSSTSSSSTSSSSSSTSSSTASTTSTTTTTIDGADAMVNWLLNQEAALLNSLLEGKGGVVNKVIPGAKLVAFGIQAGATGRAAVKAEGSDAGVSVPVGVLKALGLENAVGVMTVLDNDLASTVGPVEAALNFNLYNETGGKISVSGAKEPFYITLDINRTQGDCSYYDEETKQWSSKGLREVPPEDGSEDGPLVCASSHLTFFAAILKGFLSALMCAQLSLLTGESMSQLFVGNWWYQPVSCMWWLFLFVFGSMFTLSCVLDHRRKRDGVWDDECFLIPINLVPAISDKEEVPEVQEETSQPMERDNSIKARAERSVAATIAFVCAPCIWCLHSDACKDAIDEICSRWFEYFGEVRNFFESICGGIHEAVQTGHVSNVLSALVGALVTSSVRRQTSASLGISEENVQFITEDEDLGHLLAHGAKRPKVYSSSGSMETDGNTGAATQGWEKHLVSWCDLHSKVLSEFDGHWKRTDWKSFPMAFGRLFMVSNPFTSVLLGCRFMSSSLRCLFFATDIFGSLVVATLFFQASGGAVGKESDDECSEDPASIGEELGRIMAIALGSLIVASLPSAIIGSMHNRGFKKFEYEGCPEWNRQLRSWRMQDKFIWVFGGAYLSFCTLFVTLFLANTAPGSMPEWGMTGALSLAEDALIIPFAIAFLIPFFATIALTGASWATGVHARDVLQQRREELENRAGNWAHVGPAGEEPEDIYYTPDGPKVSI